jgi:hypothetical protein
VFRKPHPVMISDLTILHVLGKFIADLFWRFTCYLHCLDVSSCFRQRIGSSIECASSGVFGVTHYCGALQRYH